MFIDIGVNLTNKRFNKDLAAVIDRARAAGVSQQILTGTSVKESVNAQRLAAQTAGLFSTAGVHPHDAKHWSDAAAGTIRGLAAAPEVVAIGECGLDHNRNFSTPADQARAFEAQIALAVETQLPLFMHERDAADAFLAILAPELPKTVGGVVHCFTGDKATLKRYLDLGLYIGVTGWICDERRGGSLQEAVSALPLDRLLLETDAPYLTPRDLRPKPKGGRNEPAFLPHIAQAVAHFMGATVEAVTAAAHKNTCSLFALNGGPS